MDAHFPRRQISILRDQSPSQLADINITHELSQRPVCLTNAADELLAITALSGLFRISASALLDGLVEYALKLTDADSSGVSLLEWQSDDLQFRWVATAGEFTRYKNGTMNVKSPCGAVCARQASMLLYRPVRYFREIEKLHRPVIEVLLVPVFRNTEVIGTVWAVMHSERKQFTGRDERLLTRLTDFTERALAAMQ